MSAAVAVLRNGCVDRAPMVGWLVLRMPRYGGVTEALNRCRFATAREEVRRRLFKRGRSSYEGGRGCRRLPSKNFVVAGTPQLDSGECYARNAATGGPCSIGPGTGIEGVALIAQENSISILLNAIPVKSPLLLITSANCAGLRFERKQS